MNVLEDQLPPEILHGILRYVAPKDLASLGMSSIKLHRFVSGNLSLFRDVYLNFLDEPPSKPNVIEYDWIAGVKAFVKLVNVLSRRTSFQEKIERLHFIESTITELLKTATGGRGLTSFNVRLLEAIFTFTPNRRAIFQRSNIFRRARLDREMPLEMSRSEPFVDPRECQMSAKLHTLYGVSTDLFHEDGSYSVYPYACSVVYDLRLYNTRNFWGPYLNDGEYTVDWERLEAVMIVLNHNLAIHHHDSGISAGQQNVTPWRGAFPNSYSSLQILGAQPAPPLAAYDPFNVTGTWKRVVCYLDFSELFGYNFVAPDPGHGRPRPPLDRTEAIRLIVMEIEVNSISLPDANHGYSPIVGFEGTTRSLDDYWDPNAHSAIKGTVRKTKEGEVRWTTLSTFHGEERWKSEGIQVGGVNSARGVVGHWFDKDYDDQGPAGPTAFWKITDQIQPPNPDSDANSHADDEDEDELSDSDIEIMDVINYAIYQQNQEIQAQESGEAALGQQSNQEENELEEIEQENIEISEQQREVAGSLVELTLETLLGLSSEPNSQTQNRQTTWGAQDYFCTQTGVPLIHVKRLVV